MSACPFFCTLKYSSCILKKSPYLLNHFVKCPIWNLYLSMSSIFSEYFHGPHLLANVTTFISIEYHSIKITFIRQALVNLTLHQIWTVIPRKVICNRYRKMTYVGGTFSTHLYLFLQSRVLKGKEHTTLLSQRLKSWLITNCNLKENYLTTLSLSFPIPKVEVKSNSQGCCED